MGRLLIGGLVVIACIVAARLLPVGEWLDAFDAWVAGLGWLGIAIFIVVYIIATVLFVPGTVLTLGAGIAFGLAWGFVAVSLGSTLGAAAAFLVARHGARDAVARRFGGGPRFAAIDRAIGREGAKIVFLLRLSPVFPFNALNYLLGLTAVGFWPYVITSFIGMMPGTLLFVYLGYAGKTGLDVAAGSAGPNHDLLRSIYLGAGLIATIVATIYVTKLARRALRWHEENTPR